MSFIKDSCLEVATALRHARALRRRGAPESEVRALPGTLADISMPVIDDMRVEGIATLNMDSPPIAAMEAALEAVERHAPAPGSSLRTSAGNTLAAPDPPRSSSDGASMVGHTRLHLGFLIEMLHHRRQHSPPMAHAPCGANQHFRIESTRAVKRSKEPD